MTDESLTKSMFSILENVNIFGEKTQPLKDVTDSLLLILLERLKRYVFLLCVL